MNISLKKKKQTIISGSMEAPLCCILFMNFQCLLSYKIQVIPIKITFIASTPSHFFFKPDYRELKKKDFMISKWSKY